MAHFDQSLPGDFSQFTPAQAAQLQAEAQAAAQAHAELDQETSHALARRR